MPNTANPTDCHATKSSVGFLFWNLQQRDRSDLVAQLVAERDVDIVIIAEGKAVRETMVEKLWRVDPGFYEPIPGIGKLLCYIRTEAMAFRELFRDDSGRLAICSLNLFSQEFLLAVVHLVSKAEHDVDDQSAEAQILSERIRLSEETRPNPHQRTIALGDFNMNPFETGMTKASGFHGMMSRCSVKNGSRVVQSREYGFFYNPMWSFLGDLSPGPAGTLHHKRSGHQVSYDWNMFDQVLFRRDVLPWFQNDIEIVTRIGNNELTDEHGRPDPNVGSDHFPIYFRLQENSTRG